MTTNKNYRCFHYFHFFFIVIRCKDNTQKKFSKIKKETHTCKKMKHLTKKTESTADIYMKTKKKEYFNEREANIRVHET